jgi:competence ComEA-like helix-hairpin-helix protein
MSFYRKLFVAVAAMGLASTVFADDAAMTPASTDTTTQTAAPSDTTGATSPTADATTEKTTTTTTDSTTTTTADKVDLNKATVKELMKVKGLNAARAKAIVTYRKKHGDFKSIDDLKMVKGFKKLNDKKMQEIADQVTAG